jgi:acyl carrier protein
MLQAKTGKDVSGMTQDEKVALFKGTIETDMALTPETELKDIELWDSLARLSTLIMFNTHFNKTLDAEKFAKFKTVGDILAEMEK